MGVLKQGEDYVGFRRIGVKALIFRLVVLLQHNYGVLQLAYLKVGTALVRSHYKGLCSGCSCSLLRVYVDGDEEVCLVAVGNLRTLGEFYIFVPFSCIYNFNIGIIGVNHLAQLQCHGEGYILLLYCAVFAYCAGIFAAVARIQHNGLYLYAVLCALLCRGCGNKGADERHCGNGCEQFSYYYLCGWHICCKICINLQTYKDANFLSYF